LGNLRKNEEINQNRSILFGGRKEEDEIDEKTFIEWKSELQRGLPTFWESMIS
jgi:hypothetical protein